MSNKVPGEREVHFDNNNTFFYEPYETKENDRPRWSDTDEKTNHIGIAAFKQRQDGNEDWELFQSKMMDIALQNPEFAMQQLSNPLFPNSEQGGDIDPQASVRLGLQTSVQQLSDPIFPSREEGVHTDSQAVTELASQIPQPMMRNLTNAPAPETGQNDLEQNYDPEEIIDFICSELEQTRLALQIAETSKNQQQEELQATKRRLEESEKNKHFLLSVHLQKIEQLKASVSNATISNETHLFFSSFFNDQGCETLSSLLSKKNLYQSFIEGYSNLLSGLNFQKEAEELDITKIGQAEMLLRECHGIAALFQEVDFLWQDRKNRMFRYASELNSNLNFAEPESVKRWEKFGLSIELIMEWFAKKLAEKKIPLKLNKANLIYADLLLRADSAIRNVMTVINKFFKNPQSYLFLLEQAIQITDLDLADLEITVLPQLITHGKWPNLKTLSISRNPIDHIPSGAFLSMNSLRKFYASETFIKIFPHDIMGSNFDIEIIDLGSCCLNGLSPKASQIMPKLTTVNVGPFRLEDISLEISSIDLPYASRICQIAELTQNCTTSENRICQLENQKKFFKLLDKNFSVIMEREVGSNEIMGWFSTLDQIRKHNRFPQIPFKDLAPLKTNESLKSLYTHLLAAHGILLPREESFERYEKVLEALDIANATLRAINIAIEEMQETNKPRLPKALSYYHLCRLQEQNQLGHIVSLDFPIMLKRIPNFVLLLPNLKTLTFPKNSPLDIQKSQVSKTSISEIYIGGIQKYKK